MTADSRLTEVSTALGYAFDGDIQIGGNYVSLVRDASVIYISDRVPRVGRHARASVDGGSRASGDPGSRL